MCVWGLLLTLPVLAMADSVRFNIPAQPLPAALKAFAAQASMQLLYRFEAVESATANAVIGEFDKRAALKILLDGTGLEAIYSKDNAATIRPARAQSRTASKTTAVQGTNGNMHLAQAEPSSSLPSSSKEDEGSSASTHKSQELPSPEETGKAIPEVLVIGTKSLNMDIPRSRDDAQPYVIFNRDTIERSGSSNIGEFLKTRLPMNSVSGTSSQVNGSINGNVSQINLRGLGTSQTLVLLDGRRVADLSTSGNSFSQADVNGIPLAAIERIEVLPTTASAIYGGGATGGVVNIILRRNYSGAEIKATYGNTFESDAAAWRIDFGAGLDSESGRTSLLVAGSYAEQDSLELQNREFAQRGRNAILANNPGFLLNAPVPLLGATPNIRSADGSPLFGPNTPNVTSVPVGYTGGGGLAAFQPNAGQYNLDLATSTQVSGGGLGGLLNGPTVKSGIASLHHQFGERFEAFLEVGASSNVGHSPASLPSGIFSLPASAPTNPFGRTVFVTVPIPQGDGILLSDNETLRAAGGLIFDLPQDWRASADFTWNRSRHYSTIPFSISGAAAAAVAAGTLDILRDPNAVLVDFGPYLNPPLTNGPFRSTLKDGTLRFAGPTGSLPGGPITVSALLEYQHQELSDGYETITLPPTLTFFFPRRSHSIESAYLEAIVPLVGSHQGTAAVRELELQLGGRWDRYTINGATGLIVNPTPTSAVQHRTDTQDSINPTVGIRYQPAKALMLRASYSEGFVPPGVNQLIPTTSTAPSTVIDPRRGGLPVTLPPGSVTSGGNPDLAPEESRSWSAGIVFNPEWAGLRVSVDYVRIEKTEEIQTLTLQQIVDSEAFVPERVTRAPAAPGDPFGVGPIIAANNTAINLARTEIEAFDAALDFKLETAAAGTFNFFAAATRQTHYRTQLLPTNPFTENAGISSAFPLKLRANAGITWTSGPWSLAWSSTYFDSYRVADPRSPSGQVVIANQGSTTVPSQLYNTVAASWRPTDGAHGAVLDGLQVDLGITNVFDKDPPFDAGNTIAYYSLFADPRLRSYYLSVAKRF